MILSEGELIHGYEVLDCIGAGAASVVYEVLQRSSGSCFALKLLIEPSLVGSKRFSTEAGILSQLRHRNVVRSHGFLVVRGHPAMLLERVEGPDMRDWLGHEGRSAGLATRLSLLQGVLAGTAHAHARGIVHRDLKPSNVLVVSWGEQPRAKVADFGLAKLLSPDAVSEHLTRTGTAMGTIGFIAPEQILDAKRVDHRADLWSLGCLAYELLSGVPAFTATRLFDFLNQARARDFLPLARRVPTLEPGLVRAVESCLSPDPAQRPAGCDELAEALGLDVQLPKALAVAPIPTAAPVAAAPGPAGRAALETMLPDEWLD